MGSRKAPLILNLGTGCRLSDQLDTSAALSLGEKTPCTHRWAPEPVSALSLARSGNETTAPAVVQSVTRSLHRPCYLDSANVTIKMEYALDRSYRIQ
jgi:hypothetical protein